MCAVSITRRVYCTVTVLYCVRLIFDHLPLPKQVENGRLHVMLLLVLMCLLQADSIVIVGSGPVGRGDPPKVPEEESHPHLSKCVQRNHTEVCFARFFGDCC